MARYAPIMPIKLFESYLDLCERDHLKVGDYYLLLAHDVLNNASAYQEIFGERNRIPEDSFVILDNSVIELGKAMEATDLARAAHIVRASCIVLPDVLGDIGATLSYAYHTGKQLLKEAPGFPLLGMVQGKNVAQLQNCAHSLACMDGIAYFGCPRWVADAMGTRKVFEPIFALDKEIKEPCVHMFGMSNNINDDLECARLPGVMGIDSANPIVMGQRNLNLFTEVERDQYIHYPRQTATFDFWLEETVTTVTRDNIEYMNQQSFYVSR